MTKVPSGGMRSDATSAPGRVLRAGLLLPLLAGVLAMHVLLLCSDGSTGPHTGHVTASVSPAPGHPTARTAAHPDHADRSLPTDTGPAASAVLSDVLAAAGGAVAGPSDGGLAVCLAVLGGTLVLLLARRGALVAPPDPAPARPSGRRPHRARPPPPTPLRLLLCVSRT